MARMGKRREAYRALVGKPEKKRNHLEDIGVDGKILKTNLKEIVLGPWSRMIWLTIGTSDGLLCTR